MLVQRAVGDGNFKSGGFLDGRRPVGVGAGVRAGGPDGLIYEALQRIHRDRETSV